MLSNPLQDYSDLTVFAECPSCHKLIKMKSFTEAVLEGAKNCPFCQVFIDKKEIVASCESYLKITKAIQSAEIFVTYQTIFMVFALVVIEMAFIYFGDGGKFHFLVYLLIFVSIGMLLGGFLNVQNWLSEFGQLQTADEEFNVIRKKVRHAQIVWVWANVVNLIWWFVYIVLF